MNSTTKSAMKKRPMTPQQCAQIERMPAIADSEFYRELHRIPAAHYTDQNRFDLEQAAIYRRKPVLIGPSALIPEANMYFRREVLGTPLLVTRNSDGLVRAFVNVCSHRGSKLCNSEQPVAGERLVCPYHAWTYNLDGGLIGIPREKVFPGIDKAFLGLTALPCAEAGGLIWVGTDPKAEVDFSFAAGELADDLTAIGLHEQRLFNQAVFDVKANWKLVMDTMNDSYHVIRLHKNSLAQFFVDAQHIIDPIGPHVRVAAHRGNFDKSMTFEDFEEARGYMVFAYTLFPNSVVVVSPDFISVGVMEPVACDRTRVHYYMLVNDLDVDEKAQNKLQRSFALMERAFGQEDYWAAEQCDEGLRAGVLEHVVLGGMEVQIPMFHKEVDKALDEFHRDNR